MAKKIIDIFWTPGSTSATVAAPAAPAAAAPVTSTKQPVASSPVAASSTAIYGVVNEDMKHDIVQAIQLANIPGYDYLELMEAVGSMSGLPFTFDQKVQAAMATSTQANQGKPVDRAAIMTSIVQYIGIVNATEKEFIASLSKKSDSQVGGRLEQVKSLDTSMEEDAKQILALTEKINATKKQKEQILAEAEEKRVKIEGAKASFIATAAHMREKLENDRAAIERALATTTPAAQAT